MRLANCNEHLGESDPALPCWALRHDDGKRVTPEEAAAALKLFWSERNELQRQRDAWKSEADADLVVIVEMRNEIGRMRGEAMVLRATMEGAVRAMEQARSWDGMGWHYNPLHPMHYVHAHDRLREVIDTTAPMPPNVRAKAAPAAAQEQ